MKAFDKHYSALNKWFNKAHLTDPTRSINALADLTHCKEPVLSAHSDIMSNMKLPPIDEQGEIMIHIVVGKSFCDMY